MIDLYDSSGKVVGEIALDPAVFDIEPNQDVMHQVVMAQRAAARSGTSSTRTRAERRGGGAKPWRQKGTGRARQGSIRSPQWRGGGIVFGPKPRDYSQRTPKRMIRLALRSALSDRARGDRIRVVEDHGFDIPSTKTAKSVLEAVGIEGRPLIVIRDWYDELVVRSYRNLPEVHLIPGDQVNCYDVLRNDYVLLTPETLECVTAKATRIQPHLEVAR